MAAGYLKSLAPVADGLFAAAHAGAALARKKLQGQNSRRGASLRAGAATPLWNELATAVEQTLRKRGEKAKLARILGVSRQRLHLLVVAKTAFPDAERTLLLLQWLRARQQGLDLA